MRNNSHIPVIFRPAEDFSPVTLRIFSFVYIAFACLFGILAIAALGCEVPLLALFLMLPCIYSITGFVRMSQTIPLVQQKRNVSLPKRRKQKIENLPEIEKKPVIAKIKSAGVKDKQPDVHPVYKQRLTALNEFAVDLAERMDSMEYFLDEYFGNSNISKSRYLQVTKDAQKLLENNYKKASQAAIMFGTKSKPTPERIQILDNYVKDSQDVADKMEIVINQLVAIQQNDTIRAGDILDASLEELARTTKYYSKETTEF